MIRSSLLSVTSGLSHFVFVFVLNFAEQSRVCTCNIRHVQTCHFSSKGRMANTIHCNRSPLLYLSLYVLVFVLFFGNQYYLYFNQKQSEVCTCNIRHVHTCHIFSRGRTTRARHRKSTGRSPALHLGLFAICFFLVSRFCLFSVNSALIFHCTLVLANEALLIR